MRLKRLEMVGFKSFAQKTVVELNPGVTAVVGPNGCGKSNIVDALRWAMGEQSARHLRGQQMEDVIFNGSDSLPATGMAEVSIVFDNEDGRGPADYNNFSEIMITRRLFRSGDSEYAINKINCRLKDIVDLFLGTGVGSKAYSIVEQGKVDELVNAKPEDRRSLIEEAAGTSKYKSRKIVAEKKLEKTHQNLLRVSDIVREIERQIRAMELQAKKAERFKALKDELRGKDVLFATLQRDDFNHAIGTMQDQVTELDNRLAEHLASLHAKEAENEAIRLTLLEADKEIGVQQEDLYQRRTKLRTEEQKCDFLKRELQQLEVTEEETRSALSQLDERTKAIAQEIAELSKAKESFIQLSLFEETYLQDKERELTDLQATLRSTREELDREKSALVETTNQIALLDNDIAAKEVRKHETDEELQELTARHAAVSQSLVGTEQQRDRSQRTLEDCLNAQRERTLEATAVAATVQALNNTKAEHDSRILKFREQQQETRSRLQSLEDLQRNYEGYQEGVRAIMLKRQQSPETNDIHGLVAEVIEAPESYEKALTAVLGDRLQYVIVKGHEEGVEAIEYLKGQASGRGSFIPMQLKHKPHACLPLGETEVIAPLLEVIAVREGYQEVAEYLLSDVVLVRDLTAGLSLFNRNGYQSTMVTPDGEVIDPMGIVTGGSGNSLDGSILTQRRRMRELSELLVELDRRLNSEREASETIKCALEEAEAKKASLTSEMHRLDLDRVRFEHENIAAKQEFERLSQSAHALAENQDQLRASHGQLSEEISASRNLLQARQQSKATLEHSIITHQAAFEESSKHVSAIETDVTQSRIRNAALSEKRENTLSNLANRTKQQEETNHEICSRQAKITDCQNRRHEIEQSLLITEENIKTSQEALRTLEEQLQTARQSYRGISMQLAEIGESLKELRPIGEAWQQDKNRLQLALAEKRVHLQHLADNVREKYDADLPTLTLGELDELPAREDLINAIEELRDRIERMGVVNLAAIGEYEELTERFEFMRRQKEDLEKSIADLQQTIVKLNRICRLRFKESFDAITEKFEAIFPRLFRGGKAKLVLTDENDYLETGVDIVIQPPGKKLQSITLLSGGEKALTAVSLLFAIFLTKPSPFCFLDEVDAPLDDANIDRFNDLIKDMSEFSQFVLVTHNKKSMQIAEVLYGITMAEPGVSKVVSVRMS